MGAEDLNFRTSGLHGELCDHVTSVSPALHLDIYLSCLQLLFENVCGAIIIMFECIMFYLFVVCMCVWGHLYAMTHVEVRGKVTVSVPFIIWFLTTQVAKLDSKCLCLRN